MEPINNLSKVMELLRRQMATRSDKSGSASRVRQTADAVRHAESNATIEQRVLARLVDVDPASDSFSNSASRIFLDEVLRGEFGEELWATPEFQSMVVEIQKEWQQDSQTVRALRDLVRRSAR